MDLPVASIAISEKYTLLTHNTRPFRQIPELKAKNRRLDRVVSFILATIQIALRSLL